MSKSQVTIDQNVVIKDDYQYVTISAGNGYRPTQTIIKSGIKTKLIIKTNNAYDCSSSLTIPQLKYSKVLPVTGEEIIDIGKLDKNTTLKAACSMGMYSFEINAI